MAEPSNKRQRSESPSTPKPVTHLPSSRLFESDDNDNEEIFLNVRTKIQILLIVN